ncbi:hypothetical protein F9K84_21205 [Brucella anthropi]|uniref:hypothetical protein n=1 Tax=Brucella anthropi TaxID=529 RepID=UPI00124F1AE2|nr:hypothetical protein [Brucella anthropi]KAB2766061.1 hypothetical protein F9K84_21205 [Brucella anthropi]
MEPEISFATALMLAAMNATKTERAGWVERQPRHLFTALEFDGLLLLDIQELDRDGGALFTVLQPATV